MFFSTKLLATLHHRNNSFVVFIPYSVLQISCRTKIADQAIGNFLYPVIKPNPAAHLSGQHHDPFFYGSLIEIYLQYITASREVIYCNVFIVVFYRRLIPPGYYFTIYAYE